MSAHTEGERASAQESRGSCWEGNGQDLGLWRECSSNSQCASSTLGLLDKVPGPCHVGGKWCPVCVALLLVWQWHPEKALRIQRTWMCWRVCSFRKACHLSLGCVSKWPTPFKMSPYNQCSRVVLLLILSFLCVAFIFFRPTRNFFQAYKMIHRKDACHQLHWYEFHTWNQHGGRKPAPIQVFLWAMCTHLYVNT